ncbi:hypothetical protein NL676_005185 [Syzygium grande]|nr:hypothetical protein NL676_005185 [Syzygium grande]
MGLGGTGETGRGALPLRRGGGREDCGASSGQEASLDLGSLAFFDFLALGAGFSPAASGLAGAGAGSTAGNGSSVHRRGGGAKLAIAAEVAAKKTERRS